MVCRFSAGLPPSMTSHPDWLRSEIKPEEQTHSPEALFLP